MTQFQVAWTLRGFQCFRTVNGIYRLNVGPPFPDPKSAIRYAKSLEAIEAADVSPLRTSPAEPSDPRPVTPSRSGLVSDGSAGVRELATRLRGQAGE